MADVLAKCDRRALRNDLAGRDVRLWTQRDKGQGSTAGCASSFRRIRNPFCGACHVLKFEPYQLDQLGAFGSALGEVDGDGDMEIVACAMTRDTSTLNSVLLWGEQ